MIYTCDGGRETSIHWKERCFPVFRRSSPSQGHRRTLFLLSVYRIFVKRQKNGSRQPESVEQIFPEYGVEGGGGAQIKRSNFNIFKEIKNGKMPNGEFHTQ